MCKGPSDTPVLVVQQALMDNLYLGIMGAPERRPVDYQPKPEPHPKPKPNPLDYGVPDLDLD